MTEESIIILLEQLLALTLLIVFFNGPWQSMLVELTRQRLFRVRNSIFLYAAEGKIDFKSDTYNNIRNRINSAIRFCHHINLSNVITALIAQKTTNGNNQETISIFDMISEIDDPDLRELFEEKAETVMRSLAILIILRSPLTVIMLILLLPVFIIYWLFSNHFNRIFKDFRYAIERDIIMGDRNLFQF